MNYSRAFSYVFEDKNWLSKILIAGLISLIPIVGQIYLLGWTVEIVRRVKAGRSDILPTTHFSYFLMLGLKMFVVTLIYSIPAIILSAIFNGFGATASHTDQNFVATIFAGFSCFGGLLTLVVELAMSLMGTYGMIKLAETDQIKACLNFTDGFNCIKENLSTFLIVMLLDVVAGLIAGLGVALCFVGVILTAPYAYALIGNLTGQLWNNLKPYNSNSAKGPRGAAPAHEDVIVEAPFTKVEDIENATHDEQPEPEVTVVEDAIIIDEVQPVDQVEDTTDNEVSETSGTPDVPEIPETHEAAETPESPEVPETSETDEPQTEDDIPSFE